MRKIIDNIFKTIRKYHGIPLIAMGIIICIMLLKSKGSNEILNTKDDSNNEIVVQDENTYFKSDDEPLNVYGIKEIRINEGSTLAKLNYLNPEQNADKYYITVKIILKENNELIYTSDPVPPGAIIGDINLNRSLDKGTYEAVLKVSGYKMNDFSFAKSVDFDIKIISE